MLANKIHKPDHRVCAHSNDDSKFHPLMPTVAICVLLQHPVPDLVKPSFAIFDTRALTLSRERQSARVSKITNNGLIRSGTGCFIAVPI